MAKRKKNKSTEEEMTFIEHLEELRWHIVRAVASAFVFMVIAFINRDFIFNEVILKPKTPTFPTNMFFANLNEWFNSILGTNSSALAINNTPLDIVNIDMAGQFIAHIKVSLVAGIIVASPYIIWEIWRFIKPALHNNESQYASGGVFYTSVLFLAGILFGYYLIAPLSIHFLGSYNVSNEVHNTIKLNSYIGTLTSVTFASGIIFELPVAALFLSKVGLLTPTFMRKYRKHAYVILLIMSAIITPPDVFSQILVCVPLISLYEISIHISRYEMRKQQRTLDNTELSDN
ncbi:MAG: twin-arginine translocase subunit TatC [Prolixibacteraceae bacterium]|jgi:sec-independent protein translocase protein TatC|nr:twin-arginine translocase subunit TatC [Prolixibacteraceae bacterium]